MHRFIALLLSIRFALLHRSPLRMGLPILMGGLFIFSSLFYIDESMAVTSFEQKATMLNQLLTQSQMKQKGDSSTQQLIHEARLKLQQAIQANQAGNAPLAEQLLSQAFALTTKASRSQSPDSTWLYKERFEAMLESTTLFRNNYQRHWSRLNQAPTAAKTPPSLPLIADKIAKAQDLAKQNQYPQAVEILEETQKFIGEQLKQLIGSNQIVYELKFASPEEELDYENNRVTSLETLLQMMLSEKNLDANKMRLIEQYAQQSQMQRQKSRQEASNKEYKSAIQSMEEAGNLLMRALRTAGLSF